MFGKVIGGGLPLAAVGGAAAVMDELAPDGPVYQAGTLSGNPLATAGGLAALEALSPSDYVELEARVTCLADGLGEVFRTAGIAAQVGRVATLMSFFLAESPVRDFDDAKAADHGRYAALFRGLLDDHRIFLAPSGYEAMFVSLAHTDDMIEATVDAVGEVFGAS